MSTEYIKTNWQDGDIITADKMNNIENGIKDVEEVATGLKEDLNDNVSDLKSAFNNAIYEEKPNLLDPNKILKDKVLSADNRISNSTNYEVFDYIAVQPGSQYTLAEMRNGSIYNSVHISRTLAYKSSNLSDYTSISETTYVENRWVTIPDGYDMIRCAVRYTELTDPDAPLMLYCSDDGFATELIKYGVVTKRALNQSDYITKTNFNLFNDIVGTEQTVTFNSDGTVASVKHTNTTTSVIERQDVFTYSGSIITEVRTLVGGQSITIITDINTLTKEVI